MYMIAMRRFDTFATLTDAPNAQAKPDATVEVKISDDMMDVQFDFYQ